MGCLEPIREVFIKSGIFIVICVDECSILFMLTKDKVCTLCAVTSARRVQHFLDNCSSDSSSFGYHVDSKLRTWFGSQVTSYLGAGGRSLNTPLKNLCTLSFSEIECPNIKAKADLQLFREPYCAPLSKTLVRNSIMFGIGASNVLKPCVLQNSYHFLK